MQATSEHHGQVVCHLEEFCKHYGHLTDRLFTAEIIYNPVAYVRASVMDVVCASKVIPDLNGEDLLGTRQAH